MAIIADHQLAAWLQSVKELAEKILLVSYVQNCVPAEKASSDTVFARGLLLPVDNIVKVLWVGHQRRVFDIELHPVLHLGLHLDTVILSDCDHVGRQVHPVHVHPIPEKQVGKEEEGGKIEEGVTCAPCKRPIPLSRSLCPAPSCPGQGRAGSRNPLSFLRHQR